MSTVETARVLSVTPALSPTQLRCFMDCHARWWFKYRLKISDPPNGNLVLGRAVLYLPNRLSTLCSRRNCAYWRICECEWGGEVPET